MIPETPHMRPAVEPLYACALLRDSRGDYLLQLRPPSATHAADLLTCFGGRRESGESAAECLARELSEELGWRPTDIPPPLVNVRDGNRLIATFHPLLIPSGITVHTEPGFVAIYAPPACLPGLPLSPWHRLVFEALVFQAVANGACKPLTVQLADPTAPHRSCNQ